MADLVENRMFAEVCERSFHESMTGQVIDDGEISTAFSITN